MRKALFVIIIFILTVTEVFSQFDFVERPQQAQVSHNELNVLFVPQYILYSGLRIDVERVVAKKAWGVSPQFYYLSRSKHPLAYSDVALRHIAGVGMNIYRKFIKSSTQNALGYWSLGIGVSYFRVGYEQYEWVAKQFYNQKVYDYELVERNGALLRLEARATMGIERMFWNFLIVDPYVGVGYRYTMPFIVGDVNPFDTYFSVGYTGPMFIIGFKIGSGKSFSHNQF